MIIKIKGGGMKSYLLIGLLLTATTGTFYTCDPLDKQGSSTDTSSSTASTVNGSTSQALPEEFIVFHSNINPSDPSKLDYGNITKIKKDGSELKLVNNLQSPYLPKLSPDKTKILFVSNASLNGNASKGPTNLWIMHSDGSEAKPLTHLQVEESDFKTLYLYPQWSPDGNKILFISRRNLSGSDTDPLGSANLWILDADGSNLKPLTKLKNSEKIDHAAWSPDGGKITFLSQQSLSDNDPIHSNENLWIIDADGSNLKALTKWNVANIASAAWSPDGKNLALFTNMNLNGSDSFGKNYNLWLLNVENGNLSSLTKLKNASINLIQWLPDNQWIAYYSNENLESQDMPLNPSKLFFNNLWLVKSDGSERKPITRLLDQNIRFASTKWSKNGAQIITASTRHLDGSDKTEIEPKENLWIMNADGSNPMPLTKYSAKNTSVSDADF